MSITVNFWCYLQNGGDGSAFPRFFKSRESAETYASYDDERYCDDIDSVSLKFDDQGNLLTPEPQVDEWHKEYVEKRRAKEKAARERREAMIEKASKNTKDV